MISKWVIKWLCVVLLLAIVNVLTQSMIHQNISGSKNPLDLKFGHMVCIIPQSSD